MRTEHLQRMVKAVEDGDIDTARAVLDEAAETADHDPSPKTPRVPGRFKGRMTVGPEFFQPLSEEELKELTAE